MIRLRQTLIGVTLAIGLTLVPMPVQSAAADRLEALLGDIETYQARVRQLILEADGSVLEESRVRFRLKRPDGFYWETVEPWPELIVTDGETLWHYQPDLQQVTIEDWDPRRSEPTARLLNGDLQVLAEDYAIERQAGEGEATEQFMLRPLDPASVYRRVRLSFEDGELVAMQVDSTDGQRTRWQFRERVINEPLPDSLFHFDVPDNPDVEVLDNRSAAD